jgi:hypothetical protein
MMSIIEVIAAETTVATSIHIMPSAMVRRADFILSIVVSFQFDMVDPHTAPLRVFFGLVGYESPEGADGGCEENERQETDKQTAVNEGQEGGHEGQDAERKGDF